MMLKKKNHVSSGNLRKTEVYRIWVNPQKIAGLIHKRLLLTQCLWYNGPDVRFSFSSLENITAVVTWGVAICFIILRCF